jgi:flagellar motility protein MotE (MotC chaperone)
MPENLKILPLLVFVAMLAFSVRLVDVFTDMRSLSGAAIAADHKSPSEVKESNIPLPPPITGSMDTDAKGALEFPEPKDKPKVAAKPIGWQDANELDVEDTDVAKELGDELGKRRAELDRREKELQTKEALLKAGQQELERKFAELSQLRAEIEKLLQTQSEEETARIASLVKIYENMKPGDAARIFNTLDLDVLVSVMSKMSERKLSPIIGSMEAERAKAVTVILAQQKKLPELPANLPPSQ